MTQGRSSEGAGSARSRADRRLHRRPRVRQAYSLVAWATGVLVLSLAVLRASAARAIGWTAFVVLVVLAFHEALGKPLPFLRWSFLRMGLAWRRVSREWRVGDGREEQVEAYVRANAAAGDLDAVIDAFDRFAYEESFLFNVGDEKGELLDATIERLKPQRVLELGTYLGYSALRIARRMPASGHVYTIEWNADNAATARRIIEHAGATSRITVIQGSLDDERTFRALVEQHGFGPGALDVLFLDHDKDAYGRDFERLLGAGWLHPGSVVLADNVLIPGAPAYRALISSGEGRRWTTRVHRTHAEYQSLLRDEMLESTLLS